MPVALIRPFAGLRPARGRAAEIAAPPYDVLSSAEARARAAGQPWSFLHVSKAEIDLPDSVDPHDEAVYAKAAENLNRMVEAGMMRRDAAACYYVYRMTAGDHVQTGVVVGASVAAYEANRIRKHELTRPDKEDDRVRQIEAVGGHTGPVMLIHQADPEIARLLDVACAGAPDSSAVVDGTTHEIWPVADGAAVAAIGAAFERQKALYIADGHHRSAAAARVAQARRRSGATDSGTGGPGAAHESFLAVSFPADQMRILDYNRVVKDLAGLTAGGFLAALEARFTVAPAGADPRPSRAHEFAMYLEGRWHRLVLKSPPGPEVSPTARLDVSLLYDHVLAPLLKIGDPRTDKRIDFVGGARGLAGLASRVDSGEMAVAFALYPTAVSDLLAVAEAGEIMPPKSTWFEPKLADGLVSLMLD